MSGMELAEATDGRAAPGMQAPTHIVARGEADPLGHEAGAPVIAVVDPSGRLARWAGALCEMLRIRMTVATDVAALGAALESQVPLGVLCGDFGDDSRPVSQLIRLVSCYDRTMPVLLLTDDRPETLGAIDAAASIWPVYNLQRAAGSIRPDTVLAFLSRIGRANGGTRLMAI